MKPSRERILLVVNEQNISDLIARQTLSSLGYRVEVSQDAGAAIQIAARKPPHIIIANLNLSGLSGKDLLAALVSQGLEIPVVVIAQKGMEADIIQAFRLGATDFLLWPFREAEIMAVVERALQQAQIRRERELLSKQLKQANRELQRRVRELNTVFAVSKAVISITNQKELFEKIIESAVAVSDADSGWLLIRENPGRPFLLSAQYQLPENSGARLDMPWDDGISHLVAVSGETLAIHGDSLERFKVYQFGQSALVAPVKIKQTVLGILVVIRKEAHPFSPGNRTLLEALADYASISLVNVRLFQALEERVHHLEGTAGYAQAGEPGPITLEPPK
jgi:DNA-binding response OmpR family regulator